MNFDKIISESVIVSYFERVKGFLLNINNRQRIELTRAWAYSFTNKAGVYCLFLNDILMYVGETGSIQGRMLDLLNTMNHTCRRSIGEKHFGDIDGFEKATSNKKFPKHIETKLDDLIKSQITVSTVTLRVGRKEFEEWMQDTSVDIVFYNKRKGRKIAMPEKYQK